MKLKLHHINLCTENIERMDAFYKDVLQLSEDKTADLPTLVKATKVMLLLLLMERYKLISLRKTNWQDLTLNNSSTL